MVTSTRGFVLGLLVAAVAACASGADVTPAIVISPGAKERIMMMDRFRHHGAPRRWLPRVTVEEVDEAELPAASDGEDEDEDEDEDEGASIGPDAGTLDP